MELWTISNGTYKLIIESSGNEEMYDLANDPYEQDDLLDGTLSSIEQNVKSELETELISIRQ
jgi:hypothetical protein